METVLSFREGRFLLINKAGIARKSLDESYWKQVDSNTFETTSLKAAAGFRRQADVIAEKVFTRTFARHYDSPPSPQPLSAVLDPHQLEGIEWALSRSRSYLAHAPGAGKTAQAIVAACLAEGPGQNVFIVPPSLTRNWDREIIKFTDLFEMWPTIGVVGRSDKQDLMAWRAEFLIIPDSMLTAPWVYDRLAKMRIKVLAVDEASRFKESTAERTKALFGGVSAKRTYPGLFHRARHTILMDGSPMPNRPMELWAPTYAMNPEAIDCLDQRDFGFRYCGPTLNERGNYEFNYSSNEEELKEKLQKDFMHVVTEERLSHPERRRSMLFMNRDVRSLEHKTWERRHLPSLKDLDEDSSQGELASFRRQLGLRKVPWIVQYIRERMEAKNESILLFVWHREVALHLAKQLSPDQNCLVIGGVSEGIRELIFHNFQTGKLKLIIGNIQAMGRGHNLQRADRVIFGEFSWTDELNKQCEKRASRRGSQKEFVRCEYIVCPDSMDETVMKSLFTKEKRVKRVIG